MKKILTAVLAIMLSLTMLAACGGNNSGGGAPPSSGGGGGANSDSGSGGGTAASGDVYVIADYYKDDGNLSELGETLGFHYSNGERFLTLSKGDVITAGNAKYIITAEELTFFFYTQPSMKEVLAWWAGYMNDLAQSGDVKEV